MAAVAAETTWLAMSKTQTFCPLLNRAQWLLSDRKTFFLLVMFTEEALPEYVPMGNLFVLLGMCCAPWYVLCSLVCAVLAPWCALCSLLCAVLPAVCDPSLLTLYSSLLFFPFLHLGFGISVNPPRWSSNVTSFWKWHFPCLKGEYFLISAAIVLSKPWVPYSVLQKSLNSCFISSPSS